MSQQDRNAELVALLETDFIGRNEPNYAWKSACAAFQALPGVRGFWPMSAFGSAGNTVDLVAGRTLTYNGNPIYGYDGLAPYIELDGTGDYLSRLDEAGLDILGTEAYVDAAYRGLTLGGWFYFAASPVAANTLIAKDDTGAQRQYRLRVLGGDTLQLSVFPGPISVSSVGAVNFPAWNFCVGKYDQPSQTVFSTLNGTPTAGVAGAAPAALNNSTAALAIGGTSIGTLLFTGKASMCFLCAQSLSDSIIDALFQQTRAMFNV